MAPSPLKILSLRKLWDDGTHNGFTDMIRFRGRLYLAFRSHPETHNAVAGSMVVILSSEDGEEWREVYRGGVESRDIRDPHFVEFQGKLFVYCGSWYIDPVTGEHPFHLHKGYAIVSEDGEHWSQPIAMESTFGYYVWRTAAWGDTVYLCGRRIKPGTGTDDVTNPPILQAILLASKDGLEWKEQGIFKENPGNETAFMFEDNGDILAICRGPRQTHIGRAKPPYEKFDLVPVDRVIGGPLVVKWGSDILVGGRKITEEGSRTALSWLVDNQFIDCLMLPSGGDNSYPGFVAIDDRRAWLSYYSSHEGSKGKTAPCSIYLAMIGRTD